MRMVQFFPLELGLVTTTRGNFDIDQQLASKQLLPKNTREVGPNDLLIALKQGFNHCKIKCVVGIQRANF